MTFRGRIVEYLENGKFICAFVEDDNTKRLRLLNQNSREVSLAQNRVVHISNETYPAGLSREDLISELKNRSVRRDRLASEINLQEVWEIASEGSDESYDVNFLAGLCFGEDPSDDHCAALLRSVFLDKLYFKYKSGKIYVHPLEKVELIKLQQERETQKELLLAMNVEGLMRLWSNGIQDDWEGKQECLQTLKDYYLFGKEAKEYEYARELLKRAGLTGPHDIFHLLVKAKIWTKDENIALLKNDIPEDFPIEVISEADKIVLPPLEQLLKEGRRDLRKLPVMTIDGTATRDFDDGLHIEKHGENYLVGIHISDVGYFVKPGSALFEETLRRGTSIYFPEGPISMLPPVLSEGLCSLVKNETRPTLSFLVLLSPTAEVLEFDLVSSLISVKRQISYQEADKLIDQDNDLSALEMLSQLLRRRRVNNGALLLPFPDVNIHFKPNNEIDIKISAVDTPSRILVAEFMILANTLGAQFVAGQEAPGLYRSQMGPRQRLIDGFEKDIFKILRQRKQLSPGSLLITPKTHSGVGVPQYTTVTSPIRRLLDLIMQLQLNHLVSGKGVLFNKKEMQQFADIITNTQNRAGQAKSLRHRYWILKYLEPKVGQRLTGLVIDSGPRRTHLLLEEFLLDVVMPYHQSMKVSPGDTVSVKLARIDPLGDIVKLEW
jgi:exoribonuclease-2